jgi:hypothetical protein
MNTNPIPELVLPGWLSQADSYLNAILNLAPGPFAALVAIAVCYVPRLWRQFPNALVPAFCVFMATFLFTALAERPAEVAAFKFYVRTISTGLLIGMAAWMIHEKVISQFEDRIPFLGKWLSATSENQNQNQNPKT